MIIKTNSLIMLTANPILPANPNGENIVSINLKLFHFFFLKIVEIEFKMKLQSFFVEFSQVPRKHNFLYLSPHLSKWNESKLPLFLTIYTIRSNF